MITLATATAVLRRPFRGRHIITEDYIGYCYGGIETFINLQINFMLQITLATATAVLRHFTHITKIFFNDYIGYCYGGIETLYTF